MTISRRELLALGAGSVLGGVLGYEARSRSPRDHVSPRSSASPVAGPFEMYTSETGTLFGPEKQALFDLCSRLGLRWSMSDVQRGELDDFLDLKTGAAPSYLREYRNALRLYREASHETGPDTAVSKLLEAPAAVLPEAARNQLQHAQRFVLREFIILHLARGGARQFGHRRYAGFIGDGRDYRVYHPAHPPADRPAR